MAEDQKREFEELRTRAGDRDDDDDSDYVPIADVLYSVRKPTFTAPDYPRLVLLFDYQAAVIDRDHKEVGHMAVGKTLDRLREAYVWLGMRKSMRTRLQLCPICQVHRRRPDHVPIGDMPLATYPMQMVGADLIGPFVSSSNGNKYVLIIIDHCTGWVEAFPLKYKSNETVWIA